MAKARLPYQCLKKLGDLLVAARGSSIDLLNAVDGIAVSSWDCPTILPEKFEYNHSQEEDHKIIQDKDSHPAKKRKASLPDGGEQLAASKVGKRRKPNRLDTVTSGLNAPAVTMLEVAHRTQHVIAATGEDKNIRVFELISVDGTLHLNQISRRAMPKRPCALALTVDESTIISADKFGDVYSLPLLSVGTVTNTPSSVPTQEPSRPFVPAASELTIHSQRNRRALENQKKQINQRSERPELAFEHRLLLGHVSMLTDIKLATLDDRQYIISADRDEHIRISRGLQQTHIIEGFCLGHNDFVSRLSLLKNRPDILISGGGEDEIFVWNWLSGHILSRVDIMKHIASSWSEFFVERDEVMHFEPNEVDSIHENVVECPEKLAVSGIYHVHSLDSASDIILVTCEAIPAIVTFVLSSKAELEYIETIKLPGNVLTLLTDQSTGREEVPSVRPAQSIIVSIDNIHKPGCRKPKDINKFKVPVLHKFEFSGTRLVSRVDWNQDTEITYSNRSPDSASIGRLTNLLYNLESLRKRGEEDTQEE